MRNYWTQIITWILLVSMLLQSCVPVTSLHSTPDAVPPTTPLPSDEPARSPLPPSGPTSEELAAAHEAALQELVENCHPASNPTAPAAALPTSSTAGDAPQWGG